MGTLEILLALGGGGGLVTLIGSLVVRNTTLKVEGANQAALANAQRVEENRAQVEDNRLKLEVLEAIIRNLQTENDRLQRHFDKQAETYTEMIHSRDMRLQDLQQQLDLHTATLASENAAASAASAVSAATSATDAAASAATREEHREDQHP